MKILVTGGAGYIGSHTCVELLKAGHEVRIIDNFSNSYSWVLTGMQKITGKSAVLHECDLRDEGAVDQCFSEFSPDVVIHFAGLKVVSDSIRLPLEYYSWNITSSAVLLETMQKYGVKNFIFSSSASVYGDIGIPPVKESSDMMPTNPYAHSKMMIEKMLLDMSRASSDFHCVSLRYFNPVGAHTSGLIGECPKTALGNLFPYIADVASGKRDFVSIFGNDYNTVDGTGVRDYIHVMDLATGHLSAVNYVVSASEHGIFNLGTGFGYSVLEVIRSFEEACGHRIPVKFLPRRSGDIGKSFADCTKANAMLHWRATKDIDTMCQDAWRWQCHLDVMRK